MSDTVIVYIAGKEIARGQATSKGHVTHNEQTYLSITDFFNDSICSLEADFWWDKQQYDSYYKTIMYAGDFTQNS